MSNLRVHMELPGNLHGPCKIEKAYQQAHRELVVPGCRVGDAVIRIPLFCDVARFAGRRLAAADPLPALIALLNVKVQICMRNKLASARSTAGLF